MTPDSPVARSADARFAFGENWLKFAATIDEATIGRAAESIAAHCGLADLKGRSFLDIGSGSGLFSLAAHRLGARVTSFDFDENSVRCTESLRRQLTGDDPSWRIMQGSVLDRDFMAALGTYDIVYSWGVLHHTGDMWSAIDQAAAVVTDGGVLFMSLYNDQDWRSRLWLRIKRLYNRLPRSLRWPLVLAVVIPFEARNLLRHVLTLNPMGYVRGWTEYGAGGGRGMDRWRDWIDWIGGYPFEVATPDSVLDHLRPQGFELIRIATRLGGWGCNEYVFRRRSGDGSGA